MQTLRSLRIALWLTVAAAAIAYVRCLITLDQHKPVETQLAKLRRLVKAP